MATSKRAGAVEAEPYASSFGHLRDELARIEWLVRGQVVRARHALGDGPYRGLVISEADVDALLARSPGLPGWDIATIGPSLDQADAIAAELAERIEERRTQTSIALRLGQLQERFGLERFDLDVVMISLAPELDLRFERLYAYLHDDVTRKRPTVDLVLLLLCRSLEERMQARGRFAASAPLIRHGIVRLLAEPTTAKLAAPIKLDDRIVDWLHGSDELSVPLAPYARRIAPRRDLAELVIDTAVRGQLERLAQDAVPPVVYLHGATGSGKQTVAEAYAAQTGRALIALDAARLEGLADDAAEAVIVAAGREAWLADDVLLVEHADVLLAGERRSARAALLDIAGAAPVPIVLAGEAAWELHDVLRERTCLRISIGPPGLAGQEELWTIALAAISSGEPLDVADLAARFRLSSGQIHDAVATARGIAHARGTTPVLADLVDACRNQATRRFGPLARKVTARSRWDDLVLPPDRIDRLRELCDHAQHRSLVLDRWGFEQRLTTGKALSGLFVGAPGTGKTFAASIVAAELGLEMFQIDLASIVSKWVGETEKNLSRVFDEAEHGQSVLFFDEADSLFGKRTEQRDASDRYANLETSYLLQRIEAYQGIVILASNFRRNLDEAFVRRLRFIVDFPVPDERDRLKIWERIWPAEMPRAADLDLPWLAHNFELAGAYIRNVALASAFLAAAEGERVAQRHVLHAAKREYQKLGKMVNDSLFKGAGQGAG